MGCLVGIMTTQTIPQKIKSFQHHYISRLLMNILCKFTITTICVDLPHTLLQTTVVQKIGQQRPSRFLLGALVQKQSFTLTLLLSRAV